MERESNIESFKKSSSYAVFQDQSSSILNGRRLCRYDEELDLSLSSAVGNEWFNPDYPIVVLEVARLNIELEWVSINHNPVPIYYPKFKILHHLGEEEAAVILWGMR